MSVLLNLAEFIPKNTKVTTSYKFSDFSELGENLVKKCVLDKIRRVSLLSGKISGPYCHTKLHKMIPVVMTAVRETVFKFV